MKKILSIFVATLMLLISTTSVFASDVQSNLSEESIIYFKDFSELPFLNLPGLHNENHNHEPQISLFGTMCCNNPRTTSRIVKFAGVQEGTGLQVWLCYREYTCSSCKSVWYEYSHWEIRGGTGV